MRKLIFSLAIAIIFTLCSCSSSDTETSIVDSYKEIVQQFIDAGDMESAVKALEEGISITNDSALLEMLDKINNKNESSTSAAIETQENSDTAESTTSEVNEDTTFEENNTIIPTSKYSDYNGTWIGRDSKITIIVDEIDNILFSYENSSTKIEKYVTSNEINNNGFYVEYTTYYDEYVTYELWVEFVNDEIVCTDYTLYGAELGKESFKKLIPSNITLNVSPYLYSGGYYGRYQNNYYHMELFFEAGNFGIEFYFTPPYDKGINLFITQIVPYYNLNLNDIFLIPDFQNGNTLTYNIEYQTSNNLYDCYVNGYSDDCGQITLIFNDDGSISYIYSGNSTPFPHKEGTLLPTES